MDIASIDLMTQWAKAQLQRLGVPMPVPLVLTALDGDAGFRRYFRTNAAASVLVVYAPVATEDSAAFVAISRYLHQQQVRTPEIFAFEPQQGWLLIEDLGQELYSQALSADPACADQLYTDAMTTLLRLQKSPVMTIPAADGEGMLTLPSYDRALLRREMALFHEWFIPQLLGYRLSETERELLDTLYLQLEASALQQPQVWVHRDFHCRNLIVGAAAGPGVIDFQDAVRGPITYDLVSLLRDCYVRWPQERVRGWALAYGDRAVQAGLMAPVTQAGFLRWFDHMGLQRHLKVLGIFARLWLRDGKSGYLRDLPLVMRYTLEVAGLYKEFADFTYWFKERLLPLCEQQPWYQDYLAAGEWAGTEVSR